MDVLRQAWRAWKRFGRLIGDVIGRVVLTIFYFTIFVPFGLAVRLLSDPLELTPRDDPSYWLTRETRDRALEDGQKQF